MKKMVKDAAEELFETEADAKTQSQPRRIPQTPLMLATMHFFSVDYDFDAIKALIKAGADVNATDDNGRTSLMYAAMYNRTPEVAKALIDAGADLDAKDNSGSTALMWAARNHNPELLKALVEAGADVNA